MISLKQLDRCGRIFITAILFMLALAYAVALFQIYVHLDKDQPAPPTGMALFKRAEAHVKKAMPATETEHKPEAQEDKGTSLLQQEEFQQTLTYTHIHLFGMTFIFIALGGIFYASGFPSAVKSILLPLPFLGIVADLGGIWLSKYISPAFDLVLYLGGVVMLISFAVMFFGSLHTIWFGSYGASVRR